MKDETPAAATSREPGRVSSVGTRLLLAFLATLTILLLPAHRSTPPPGTERPDPERAARSSVARAPVPGVRHHGRKASRSTDASRREPAPAIAAPSFDHTHALGIALSAGAHARAVSSDLSPDTWTAATAQAPGRPAAESFRRPLRC